MEPGKILTNSIEYCGFFLENNRYSIIYFPKKTTFVCLTVKNDFIQNVNNLKNWNGYLNYIDFWEEMSVPSFRGDQILECLTGNKIVYLFYNKFIIKEKK